MSALRQGPARLLRSSRPAAPARNSRSYASDAHGHGHGHDHHHSSHSVDEPIGTALPIAIGAIAASGALYYLSRPGPDGQPHPITKLYERFNYLREQNEIRNTLRTQLIEQAAHDKHLLYYAPRNESVELKYPEVFHHGSPFNVPAGHGVNLDKVVAHYREKHLAEEERKAKKIAAARVPEEDR